MRETWRTLEFVGRDDAEQTSEPLEFRICECGSTISVHLVERKQPA